MKTGELTALLPDEKRALLRGLLEWRSVSALSAGQQWLWSLQQKSPESAPYHFPVALRIRSEFDCDVLRRSLQEITDRHSAFRTVFGTRNGQPVQIVRDNVMVPLDVVDASAWTAQELRSRVTEEAARPIDLVAGPVFRCKLFRRNETDSVLLLVWHHIVLDGWSLVLVLEELGAIHAAFVAEREHHLPPAAPYSEFVRWQDELLSSPEGARQAAFWRQELSGAERLDLVTDRKRPAERSYRGGSVFFTLDESLATGVRKLAAAQGTTPFVVLLAVFHALLYRVSGQSGTLVSFPVNGRTERRFAGTAGYFVNQVAVTAEIGAPTTFRDLVSRTQARVLVALEHQDYHLSLLPGADGGAVTSRPHLGGVMFVLQQSHSIMSGSPGTTDDGGGMLEGDGPATGCELGGLRVESFPVDCGTSRFDLELQLVECDGALRGWLQYDLDLFEESTARNLVARFQRLLATALRDVDQRVSDADILTPDERQRILGDWNRTRKPSAEENSVADLFEVQARTTPDAIAASCAGVRLTFRDLDRKSNLIAQWLRRSGARAGDVVGLCVPRSLDMLVALLGIVKAGGTYMPLDPSNPHERLKFMLKDSRAEFVITSTETCGLFRRTAAQQLCLHCDAAAIASCSDVAPKRSDVPLLNVIYTSGSTGEPKGVLGTQAGALNRFRWMWDRYPFSAADSCAQITTLGFVDAVWEIFGPLLRGVAIAIITDEEVRDAELLISALERHAVTRINLVPSLLRVLLESADVGDRLRALRSWSCSGESLEPDLVRLFGERVPNGSLLNLYGCSEAAGDSCYFEIPYGWDGDRVPIGRPISNTQVFLLDQRGNLVPPGSVGEIHIGGAGLAAGYLNRPELTRERFVPSPFAAGERLYRTGDLGRHLPDGNIEYFGRADQQLKIRGNRVEIGEVEAALRSHPAVESAVARGIAQPSGGQVLVAYVVTAAELVPDTALRQHLAQRLPAYMLPSHYVRLDALPLTPTGKVDVRNLPLPNAESHSRAYVAPRSETERVLAGLWASVLDVPQLGMDDDFFEWGGHSILALQVTSRASRIFKRHLSVALLRELPTVASFAAYLDGEPAMDRRHQLIPVKPRGTRPRLFWFPGGGGTLDLSALREFATRLDPEQPLYCLGTRRASTMSEIESIPERARAYVAAIREVQAEGPYFLIGFCLGGTIAFEVAQQFRADGQRVAFLGLINTWMPANSIATSQWLALFLQRTAHHLRKAFRRESGPAHRYLIRRIGAVRQALQRNVTVGNAQRLASNGVQASQSSSEDELLRATVRVASSYSPKRFDGKVHLFVSEEPDLQGVSARIDPRRAWRGVCAAFETVDVQGGHEEMLFAPFVNGFAKQFERCLSDARSRG